MGDLINFLDYKEAKVQGIPVSRLRELKVKVQDELNEALLQDLSEDYLLVSVKDGDPWPKDYPYVLEEDLDTGYHDDCDHDEWSVVEEGFQATCNYCDLNAWSAPW
ncbi:hypothetical protein UFOVP27_21 [uncultured Caudovirales phage]|uniref:Uncharacterized protein n=1 Tax=uncultured Caudovirales phage TaxID=2100421 RepID=A0A6J5KK71_9CAUD|nr:hypothetical protein UFOVP27_21 [uncultured Caudovirales phage]